LRLEKKTLQQTGRGGKELVKKHPPLQGGKKGAPQKKERLVTGVGRKKAGRPLKIIPPKGALYFERKEEKGTFRRKKKKGKEKNRFCKKRNLSQQQKKKGGMNS